MNQIDVKSEIKKLIPSDRGRVEKAFYALLPDIAESRFINTIRNKDFNFDAKERAVLSQFFVEINGRWQLTTSPEFFQLIGEEMPTFNY